MAGWRDSEGLTARERAKLRAEQERTDFVRTASQWPLSLLKGFLGFAFVLVLIFALVLALR